MKGNVFVVVSEGKTDGVVGFDINHVCDDELDAIKKFYAIIKEERNYFTKKHGITTDPLEINSEIENFSAKVDSFSENFHLDYLWRISEKCGDYFEVHIERKELNK